MKYCLSHGLRYPDNRSKCRAAGCELVDAATIALMDDNISVELATSCCPNRDCQIVVAPAKVNYCALCGATLQPISYEVWLDKFVKPGLDEGAGDLILDASKVFRAAAEMGLSGREARKRLDGLVAQRTGADSEVLDAWIQETMDLFQERSEGDQWGSVQQEALSKAKNLNIELPYAAAVVNALAQRIQSSSGGAIEIHPIAEPLSGPTQEIIDESADPIPHRSGAISRDDDVGSLRASAISFYRNMASGGHVSNNLTYLNAEKESSVQASLINQDVFLREVAHKQGTFVLFRDNNHGWVFPNPQLAFRPKAFLRLFPALTREQFNDSKRSIDPVKVISAGQGRWQVTAAEIAQGPIQHPTETLTASATPDTDKLLVAFPISAADYLKKAESSATVVRHESVRNMVVSGPNGKGEFALIHQPDPSRNFRSVVVIPRITSFHSAETYFKLYRGYYECLRPLAGDVWIMEPATVERVQGGWRILEKGVLEVRGPQLAPPPGREPISSPEVESVAVPRSPFLSSNRTGLIIATIVCTVFLIVLIASLVNKSRASRPSKPNGSQNAQVDALKEGPAPTPLDMVRIDPGTFQMGRNDGNELEKPAHSVSITKPFFIDTHEVTCQEYGSFLTANANSPAPAGWKYRKCPAGKELWPVSGIDWYAAKAYADWKGKRLPTEEEWEYAARGGNKGLLYSWGEVWKEGAANAGSRSPGHIVNVGSYAAGEFRLFDMVGNVWEWTSSDIASYTGKRLPQRLTNGELVVRGKIIRGGAWNGDQTVATATYRMGYPPSGASDYSNTGFRCVMDVPSK